MINATGNRMTREIQRQSLLANDIAYTQSQISTGKRLQRASDDAAAAPRLAALRRADSSSAAWSDNINVAKSLVAAADTAMGSTSDLLARARELALAGANATMSPNDRNSLVAELTAIADEIDSIASSKDSNGNALFSNGTALSMRFDSGTSFAPVPSRVDAFSVGGIDIAQRVRDAAAAVQSGDQTAIGGALDSLNQSIGHIADTHAAVGIQAQRLDRLSDHLQSQKIDRTSERSSLEDTDLTTAIANLNAQTITLDAAQAAFARINRRTLFDILG